jgi:hypothetical protein
MAGSQTFSKSLAGRSQFQSGEPTTGAKGPSSRSPLVWIGGLLSLCLLVLAGAIFWTRMDHGGEKAVAKNYTRPVEKPPEPARPQPVTTPVATVPDPQPAVATPAPTAVAVAPVAEPVHPVVHHVAEHPHVKLHNPETHTAMTAPPKDPTPVEQTGFVLIKSAPPFAALTINGKPQGETPMNAFLEVPVGKCHIEIVHRLSPPFDTTITVTPGYRREFKFKLDR